MTALRFIAFAGPMAASRRAVVQTLRPRHPELVIPVPMTMHAPRSGEVDGVHYHFLDDFQFDELVKNGGMLGWAKVHGLHHYGILYRPIEGALATNKSVLLGIDLDSTCQVCRSTSEVHLVFLTLPSWDVLIARLLGRGTKDKERRTRRLETAKTELAAESELDVTMTNDDLGVAVVELARVMGLEQTDEPRPFGHEEPGGIECPELPHSPKASYSR